MKILYTLLVSALLSFSFSANAQINVTFTETETTVVIDGNTSRMDLVHLHTALLEKGIDFRYDPRFNNETRLETIDFTVSANEGSITGSGTHHSLQNTNAKITFRVNKATGQYTVDKVE